MSRNDEPLHLKLPPKKELLRRGRFHLRFMAVGATIIAAGWWFGALASLFTKVDGFTALLFLGAAGLTILAILLHRIANWSHV